MITQVFMDQVESDIVLCGQLATKDRRLLEDFKDYQTAMILIARYGSVISGFPDETFFEASTQNNKYIHTFPLFFLVAKAKLETFKNLGWENMYQSIRLVK